MTTILNNKFYLLETGVSVPAGSDRVYQTDTEWVDWNTYVAHISVSLRQISFFLFFPPMWSERHIHLLLASSKPLWDMKQLVTCLRGSMDATPPHILYVRGVFQQALIERFPDWLRIWLIHHLKWIYLDHLLRLQGFIVEEDLECGPDEKENSLKYASGGLCMVETWSLC